MMLTVNGNLIKVAPKAETFKEWGAFEMKVSFDAKFRQDADLTPYMEEGVVNIAHAYVDGVKGVSEEPDGNKAKVMPAEEDPVDSGEDAENDTPDKDQNNGRGTRTGDDHPIMPLILIMMVAAMTAGTAGIYRRRCR